MVEVIIVSSVFLVSNIFWLFLVLKLIKYIAIKYDIDVSKVDNSVKNKELESVILDDEIEAKIERDKKKKFLEEEF